MKRFACAVVESKRMQRKLADYIDANDSFNTIWRSRITIASMEREYRFAIGLISPRNSQKMYRHCFLINEQNMVIEVTKKPTWVNSYYPLKVFSPEEYEKKVLDNNCTDFYNDGDLKLAERIISYKKKYELITSTDNRKNFQL